MYLIVIAWTYVVLLMSLAEAFSPQGGLLGALFTFLLYGVLPLSILMYILSTPSRKRALARKQDEMTATSIIQPDESSHAAGGTQDAGVAAVRKEER